MADETPNTTPAPAPYSPERVLEMRAGHEAAWANVAELRKIDPSQMATEKAAFLAAFDASMREQGIAEIPKAPDLVARRLAEEHGVAPDGLKPTDYDAQWAYPQDMTPAVAAEVKGWAAQLKLSPVLGKAILERISEIGKPLQALNGEQRTQFADDQRKALVSLLGTEEKADLAIAKAKKVLVDLVGELPFTKGLMANVAMNEAWLVATLSNHHDKLASLQATLAKRAKS